MILQAAERPFPFAGARRRMGDLADQRLEGECTLVCALRFGERFGMLGRVDEFHATVLADADAGLRRFDPSAADALPCLQGVEHDRFPRVVATAILVAARIPWRPVLQGRGYPADFVDALIRAGGNAGTCHGQMYDMGTLLRLSDVARPVAPGGHGSTLDQRRQSATAAV